MRQSVAATYSTAPSRTTARASSAYSRGPLQARLDGSPRQARQLQTAAAIQRQALQRKDGLPEGLKAAMEKMSGLSLDGVKVHYNSQKPAQVNALAYAQGADIYLGPGQERHLPHEAWHIVQQKQGRVRPTMQVNGLAVNDDRSLEREADLMGMRASR
ncbi:MAG: eCIS core domain-containing protein [Janthinobacterium lividum]